MDESKVIDVRLLRAVLGVIGISFPLVLWFGGCVIADLSLQESMSAYYHTRMHDVFVAFLCIIAMGLFAYRGYRKPGSKIGGESWLATAAAACAVGVAIFPPDKQPYISTPVVPLLPGLGWFGPVLHFISTLGFIGILVWFAWRFTNTNLPDITENPKKQQRNCIFRTCAIVMTCAAAYAVVDTKIEIEGPGVYWGEAIAVFAFGVSWFVKGDTIKWLQDKR